jgi:uncharacterized protein YneF (UPF0154 family)
VRFWYWLWDDWFSVNVVWVVVAVALGILSGSVIAARGFERRLRQRLSQNPTK